MIKNILDKEKHHWCVCVCERIEATKDVWKGEEGGIESRILCVAGIFSEVTRDQDYEQTMVKTERRDRNIFRKNRRGGDFDKQKHLTPLSFAQNRNYQKVSLSNN